MTVTGEPLIILLIEDDEDHAEIVIRSLKMHQVANDIRHVADGQAAMDYLFRRGEYSNAADSPRPHLILLDLRLPKVDGLDVLKRIKKTEGLLRIPVVVLTSSRAEMDVARAYGNHANSYLVKPLNFSTFTGLMRDLGFYWLGWNTNPIFMDPRNAA